MRFAAYYGREMTGANDESAFPRDGALVFSGSKIDSRCSRTPVLP